MVERQTRMKSNRALGRETRGENRFTDCSFFYDLVTCDADAKIDPLLETQFAAGRLYAVISSRPGQSGRADGYVLEGKELEVRFDQICVVEGW